MSSNNFESIDSSLTNCKASARLDGGIGILVPRGSLSTDKNSFKARSIYKLLSRILAELVCSQLSTLAKKI